MKITFLKTAVGGRSNQLTMRTLFQVKLQTGRLFSLSINKILDRISKEDTNNYVLGKSERLFRIREFIDAVSIDESLNKGNAETYIQLFNTLAQPNQLYDSLLTKQLELLRQIAQTHIESNENIVLVSGDPSSGKSYLINSFIKTPLRNSNSVLRCMPKMKCCH